MDRRDQNTNVRTLSDCMAHCAAWRYVAGFLLALLAVTFPGWQTAKAATEAEAAAKPPLKIGVFVSSRNDVCYAPGDILAIRKLVKREQRRINQQGGIGGRRVRVDFYDDQRDDNRAIANMRSVLADENMIALVGLTNSQRAKAVFDAVGDQIKGSGLPFISDISLTNIFADFPTVFTTRASQDDERMPVIAQFLRQYGFAKPAFVGIRDALLSDTLAKGLKDVLAEGQLVADHRLTLKDDKLDSTEVAHAIEDLKGKSPDLLFLTAGGARNAEIVRDLTAAGVTPAIMLIGRIDALPAEITRNYPNDFYQIAWDRLPDIYNDRLHKRLTLADPKEWIFQGPKIPTAPGWKNGECKPRIDDDEPDIFTTDNLSAIATATRYADMIELVAEAAKSAEINAHVSDFRERIVEDLKTSYATGKGIFQGSFDNWSFRSSTRAAARTPFIVRLPRDGTKPQLAAIQFSRLKSNDFRPISTLYLDVDLIRAFRVDDDEKSFFAEFYMSLHDEGKGIDIDKIEFANAFLNPVTNDRQITIRTLNKGGRSAAYPDDMMVYHVSGKFMFEPNFEKYPFDTQRFSIDLRPKVGDAPFIIQPPPESLRDRAVDAQEWIPKMQYVGYDEDFVPTIDAKTHAQSVAPFYKASFVWVMNRETTDYYLRVVVPLLFILAVAYLSIFIPPDNFEAIVTIQVTALLSAVALYLALPKIDSDTATISDRIFLFTYMAVSLMIVISIMRVNRIIAPRRWLMSTLWVTHLIVFPALIIAMAWYVNQASLAAPLGIKLPF